VFVEEVADREERRPDGGAAGEPAEEGEGDVVPDRPGDVRPEARFLTDALPARAERPDLLVELDQDPTVGL
jgi:hypothetical protein